MTFSDIALISISVYIGTTTQGSDILGADTVTTEKTEPSSDIKGLLFHFISLVYHDFQKDVLIVNVKFCD